MAMVTANPLRTGSLRMETAKSLCPNGLQFVRASTLSGFFLAVFAVFNAQAGDLEITFGAGITETFSDNVDLDAKGQEESALTTDFIGSFSLRSTSARANGGYDGSATLRHQTAGEDKGLSLLPELRGFGNIEAVENLFFIDTASSISQQVLDSGTADTQSNRETVQTHTISPYLVNRFGGFASAELRYTFDTSIRDGESERAATVGGSDLSDTITHTARFDLNSGIDFSRLRWSINALASESEQDDGNDITRRSISFNPEYAVVRSLSLLGSIGYALFEEEARIGSLPSDGTRSDFEGLTWNTGFRWRPSRRTDLEVTYGRRDEGDESFAARLGYGIGTRTRLTASYIETLETGAERLARNLSSLAVDPDTGQLIDTNTGLPFNANTGPTSVVDTVTRNKTYQANLSTSQGRNTFNLGATYREQDAEAITATPDDETGITFSGGWNRRLNPQTNFRLNGAIENTDSELGNQENTEYTVSTGIDYNLFKNLNTFVNYTYRQQDSTQSIDEYTENNISFGARANF